MLLIFPWWRDHLSASWSTAVVSCCHNLVQLAERWSLAEQLDGGPGFHAEEMDYGSQFGYDVDGGEEIPGPWPKDRDDGRVYAVK